MGGIETHVEDTTMAGKPYRSHLGNIAVRLTLVLEGRVTDIAETLGVLHSHVSAWRHGRRPVPRKHHPCLTAMLAQAIEGQVQALADLEQEQLGTLRHRLMQALVEIDTDRAAALVPIARSLRHLRVTLGKLRHATPHSASHAPVLAKVDHALSEALCELSAIAGIQHTALEHHRELYAIVTSGEALCTQVKKLLTYMATTYGQEVCTGAKVMASVRSVNQTLSPGRNEMDPPPVRTGFNESE
jgi:DNA-binding transcriptional regulator YdaS (Cro superfamily)